MSTASRPFHALPAPVKRLLYAGACLMLFIGVSAVINPDRSMASDRQLAIDARSQREARLALADGVNRPALATPSAAATTSASGTEATGPVVASSRPLLGTLTGSPYFIWVYAGASGPVYTVADRSGRVLVQEVDAAALYEQLPQVAVEQLQLVPSAPGASPGPLMLADPATQREP
jgi:hypothetical protein